MYAIAMQVHAAVKILIYLLSLVSLNFLSVKALILFCFFSVLIAFFVEEGGFVRRCLRLRWLFISIVLIHAFTVPGVYISLFDIASVTQEGVIQGLIRVAYLLIAVACLCIVFAGVSSVDLVSGLYILLKPLLWLRVDVNRLVVRLTLSLHYVEQLTLTTQTKIMSFDMFQSLASVKSDESCLDFLLHPQSLSKFDVCILCLSVVAFLLVIVF